MFMFILRCVYIYIYTRGLSHLSAMQQTGVFAWCYTCFPQICMLGRPGACAHARGQKPHTGNIFFSGFCQKFCL